jgi:hypothetical protein
MSREAASRAAYSQRAQRARDRELPEQAEIAYHRLVTDWRATRSNKTLAVT